MRYLGAVSILLLLSGATFGIEYKTFTGHIEDNQSLAERSTIISVGAGSLVSIRLGCHQEFSQFLTAYLQREDTKEIVVSVKTVCSKSQEDVDQMYKWARIFSDDSDNVDYRIVVTGAERAFFEVQYDVNTVRLPSDGTPTHHVLTPGVPSIHTFAIDNWDDVNYRFVDVSVEGWENQTDVVGKMIVTQNKDELYNFLLSPNTSTLNSMRLGYSKFGRIVLSDVSRPGLAPGVWMVGHVLFDEEQTKNIAISIAVNTDYEYVSKVVILTIVSCFGVILPIFCRYIFNYMNAERKVSFVAWRQVVINWFYSGNKGLAYLTGFLAWMLIVSAFQVVHAKWGEMTEKGDRDICYYNERCYRPYLGYYDVSVNGIASNLPFMVHGAIIILSVSLAETSCYSLQHKRYDYSIPYSFGLAFIFEGFGSLLYHICPAQIIFQFDTLFMFVISQYIITALVDGHAVRREVHEDAHKLFSSKRKSIRSPKLFLFFLGPAYGFNFLGNLHYIDPLPKPIAFFFFLFVGLWVLGILLWAAYKANLLPTSYFRAATIHFTSGGVEVKEKTSETSNLKKACFGAYTLIVVIGFIMVVMGKLVISIFILGELIVALTIMTAASFVYLLSDLWFTLTRVVRPNNKKYPMHYRYIIPAGVVLYLLCGLGLVVVSLFFFVILESTDKSIPPWESRGLNQGCVLNDFWDAHDLWHFFASHALMMIVLVVIQMQKPCRDCYMKYKECQIPAKEKNGDRELVQSVNKKKNFQEPEILKVIPLVDNKSVITEVDE